jgi:hypothetical protein
VQEDQLTQASDEVSVALNCLKNARKPSCDLVEKQEAVRLATHSIAAARGLLNSRSNNPYITSRYVRSALHHLRKWEQQLEKARLDDLSRLYKARRRLRVYRHITRPFSNCLHSVKQWQA